MYPVGNALFVLPRVVTDFMPIVGLAHSSKLHEIIIQGVAVARGHVIMIHNMLNAFDRFVKFFLVEASSIPALCEITKLVLRVIEPLSVVVRETPSFIGSIEIGMNLIDESAN